MRRRFFTMTVLAVLGTFFAGCATSSVASRKQEHYATFAALPPAQQALVDQGQIAVGMPMDAVFIAWGKPSQVSTGQTPDGQTVTTWVYRDTAWREQRFWNYRYTPYHYGRYHAYAYPQPFLDYDYTPYSYVAAEVTFQDGVVKSWRNITAPPNY
jgi:hypothetical protein